MARVNCKEVILTYLSDYLDELLSLGLVNELERHLAGCPSCVAYLNTYKRTREMVGETMQVQMPEEMRVILHDFVIARLTGGTP